ncbi:hypothetical protein CU097_014817 [Rhizopus azygosporus]|uniref:Ergothioneine biosynthesis protein 1 n=1 Tax=Rhizopus azygosporus TaxID=86630 RepID=A0A367KC67_RHIAZ|nr:hypothetical protein CU097_014817 [Rhizopus azygosporus]
MVFNDLSVRAPSPPSTGYSIIDIRTPTNGEVKDNGDIKVSRPPSPPHSADASEDAFDHSDLSKTILDSLDKPANQKSIPTYVLYDKKGLRLFDQITYLDEYYLTNAELDILQRKANELAARLENGSMIFELGAGALRKTQVILRAIEKRQIHVDYYALDLDQHELDRSLMSLGEFQYVKLFGLLGTYDQGIPWINQHFTSKGIKKAFLWLGSSIGNQTRLESALFLKRLQEMCVEPGDLCVIGFDKRNHTEKIKTAYNDPKGVTREFIMNGLDHINRIMGCDKFIDPASFAYDSAYLEKQGRHVAHYRALDNMVLNYRSDAFDRTIQVKKGELIHVEHSYKYSFQEITSLLAAAGLDMAECWTDSKDQYRLVLAEVRPFKFACNVNAVREILFPSKKSLGEEEKSIQCQHCIDSKDISAYKREATELGFFLSESDIWPMESLPTLKEWKELWKSWDLVTQQMINHDTMLFERPIALRHPFIFYLGHIPAFLDIQLSRHKVDIEVGPANPTQPEYFADIFERGIDPDMDDPTQCHPHSEVPKNDSDWPSVKSILKYQQDVRKRVADLLNFWLSEARGAQSTAWIDTVIRRRKPARALWMCFEHEAMHLETILYMLVQSPNTLPPKGVSLPSWKFAAEAEADIIPLAEASYINIAGAASVIIGHNDREEEDNNPSCQKIQSFGWDNESPQREYKNQRSFRIQTRPITNGEYLAYLKDMGSSDIPASWLKHGDQLYVRTVFGPCPMAFAKDWPAQVSYNEASGYAKSKGRRLPTELELTRFRREIASGPHSKKVPNIGFLNWTPTPVNNEQVHYLGDVWEWTDTIWDKYEGFQSSAIYPGYSADFFDGKHRVVLGGSWATHPRIAERDTFRNWYQSGYPYVFAGFRLCE